ncbi:MAG: OmpA family protein [Pseudomonas sp.]|uniref:OmpA family protein n=1 Tax=Pseudomonas sp. TaxID=306 RepID=UPI0030F2799B
MFPIKSAAALAVCAVLAGCASSPEKPETLADKVAVASAAKAESGRHWWWPFGDDKAAAPAAAPTPDPKIAQAWMDQYEPKLRTALDGSKFQLERRDNLLVVSAPVDSTFNPDRPSMLMPVTLGPITRVAKLVESDKQVAVVILGHADPSGEETRNRELSLERARAVTAIFRLSGLKNDRLMVRGFGSVLPRAANDSPEGRALNRRVEIMLTPQDTMVALLAKYAQPAPVPAAQALVRNDPIPAVKASKPAAKTAAKPGAKTAAKPAAKKTAAKPAVAAKKPASKPAPVKVAQTKPVQAASADKPAEAKN